MPYESCGLATELEHLVAIADTEHVTRAAARLGVPQPTLSRSLARLSREIGVPLVVRQGRGVRLTRHGAELAEHARRALADVRAGLDAIGVGAGGTRHATVVLGFLHSMGPAAVPHLLRGFRAAHPATDVTLVQRGTDDIVADVLAGRVDVGLVSPAPAHPDLRHRRLSRQPIVAVAPDDHRLAARRRLAVRELADVPIITMKPGYGVRTITDRLFAAAGLTPRIAFESDEMSTAAGLVAAGLGVALLPLDASAGTTGPPGTRTVRLSDAGSTRDISAVWRTEMLEVAAVRALHAHVLRHGEAAFTAGARHDDMSTAP